MKPDLAEIKEILKKNPDNPGVLKAAGQTSLCEGQFRQAKDYYSRAAALNPRLFPAIVLDYESVIAAKPDKTGPRLSLAGFEIFCGDVESALMELEESLEVNPRNVEAYNVLGRIFVKQGRTDDVIALLERSFELGVKDVALTEILAGAYLEKGRIRDAIKFYAEILNFRPGDKQVLRVLGELYARIEEYNQAALSYKAMFSDDPEVGREVIQRLEELLKIQESSVVIREVLAEVYERSLRPEEAVAKLLEVVRLDSQKLTEIIGKLREILKTYPGHPQATLALAEALRRQGNFSEAVEGYYRLVKSKPEFLSEAVRGYRDILEFCPEQVLARNYLAEAYLYQNKVTEALHEFEHILEYDPSAADSVIRKCREIIRSHPQLLLARLVLGRAHLASGDVQRAAVEAEAIVVVDKKFTGAYLLLGEAYFQMRLCRKAVEVLRSAFAQDPFNPRIQQKFREVKEKEIDLEIEKIKERIGEDPWRMALHLDLAKLYIQKGLRDEAVRELQLAQRDQIRAPFAANLLGRVYRRDGRFDLAAAQFNRALELAPSDLTDFSRTVRFNLGTTYEAQGLLRKALKIYESVLQEDIDFADLRQRLEYLKSTTLKSIRNKALVAVFSNHEKREIIAFWGRESRAARGNRKEEVSMSFGQNYNTSGFDYFMKGMYKAALEEFQLAVQLDANFAAALNNLGIALAKEGRVSEAKLRVEEAVQKDPNSVIFRNNLGVVYFMLGKIESARAELEKAHALDPEHNAVRVNYGDIAYCKKNVQQAIELYKQMGTHGVLAEIAEQRLMYKTPG